MRCILVAITFSLERREFTWENQQQKTVDIGTFSSISTPSITDFFLQPYRFYTSSNSFSISLEIQSVDWNPGIYHICLDIFPAKFLKIF